MREKLLAHLDNSDCLTIQTLSQLAEEPIAEVGKEITQMKRDGFVREDDGLLFLTASGMQAKLNAAAIQ